MLDVIIIGSGIVGAAAAFELSKYRLSVGVLESQADIACGTTKANSAIVHAGYDPQPGTLMAKLNVQGSNMMGELAQKLSVAYKQIGSLVLAFSQQQMEMVEQLYQRGLKNGVKDMRILNRQQVLEKEPNANPKVVGALYAPTAAIMNPWDMAVAMLETAVKNGVQVHTLCQVCAIKDEGNFYNISTRQGKTFQTRFIINAAGVFADDIQAMAGKREFTITPSKGEYFLLDKSQCDVAKHVLFQCPSALGKGVLVSPTAGGNLIIGPNAQDCEDKQDLSNTQTGLDFIKQAAALTTGKMDYRENVRCFAGLRAISDQDDFIIGYSKSAPRFLNAAGIKSPGLTSAPAIALMLVKLLNQQLPLKKKETFTDSRKLVRFAKLSPEEKKELIKQNPLYGKIVCRCGNITEGEIIDCLQRPVPPRTIDGVKRRCGTGMGRCQGGFCGPKIHQILAQQLHLPMEEIWQELEDSYIVSGKTKQQEESGNEI